MCYSYFFLLLTSYLLQNYLKWNCEYHAIWWFLNKVKTYWMLNIISVYIFKYIVHVYICKYIVPVIMHVTRYAHICVYIHICTFYVCAYIFFSFFSIGVNIFLLDPCVWLDIPIFFFKQFTQQKMSLKKMHFLADIISAFYLSW